MDGYQIDVADEEAVVDKLVAEAKARGCGPEFVMDLYCSINNQTIAAYERGLEDAAYALEKQAKAMSELGYVDEPGYTRQLAKIIRQLKHKQGE